MKVLCKVFVVLFVFTCNLHSKNISNEHIVFIVGEGEYKAEETMPPIAKRLEEEFGFKVTYLIAPRQGVILNLSVIDEADLLVLYIRFRQPPDKQLKRLKDYFDSGKPAVALRTTSHAFWGFETKKSIYDVNDFHELNIIEGEMIPERLGWFPPIFGGNYLTHPDHTAGMKTVIPEYSLGHPILNGVPEYKEWGYGGTYISEPLADLAEILMLGKTDDLPADPVAWTHEYKTGSRLFYTSLGTPDHFNQNEFLNLLFNSIHWTLKKEIPPGGMLSLDSYEYIGRIEKTIYPAPPKRKIPSHAITLFDGANTDMWKHYDRGMEPLSIDIDDRAVSRIGSPVYSESRWDILNSCLIATPGKGDLLTKDEFSNYRLHLDFLIPEEPDYIKNNFRGSGGVYLSGRYEIQILDSYSDELNKKSLGAIYGVKAPDKNASKPSGEWQTMIIEYRHPPNEDAFISVWLNDQKIQDNVLVKKSTQNGFWGDPNVKGEYHCGPIRLQADASRIRYANLWLEKL